MIVDFHSHTLCSDGSLEPQELADMMAERGVEAYSITDHDTLEAYGRFTPHAGARVSRCSRFSARNAAKAGSSIRNP